MVVSHIIENDIDQGCFTDDVFIGIALEQNYVAVLEDLCVENNEATYDVGRPGCW